MEYLIIQVLNSIEGYFKVWYYSIISVSTYDLMIPFEYSNNNKNIWVYNYIILENKHSRNMKQRITKYTFLFSFNVYYTTFIIYYLRISINYYYILYIIHSNRELHFYFILYTLLSRY
jgi:hypothetical protein